jgi:hypothetical protein
MDMADSPLNAGNPESTVKAPTVPVSTAYPRFLNLSEDVKQALNNYITFELQQHFTERTKFDDDIIKAQSDYYATPAEGEKTFPFKGASKLVIPLTAIAFEAVHSRTMTQAFGLKQIVSVKGVNAEWSDVDQDYEKFLDHELKQSRFRDCIEPSIIEIEKLGTGIGRVEWEQLVKFGVKNIGGTEVEFPVVVRRGAKAYSVPLSRFLMPFSATDAQTAAWCGEIMLDTQHSIYLGEQSGLLPPGMYATLYNWILTTPIRDRAMVAQEQRENTEPVWPSRIEWQRLYVSYDVDKSGRQKEIVVYYHYDSRKLLGVQYNWNADLRRPYRKGVYFPLEYRWYGIGICKQNEQFQEEVTTQHRQRIDNATLANMRMFKVSRMSGYGPKEPIFPGKMWFLDDMTHVEALQHSSEIYPSSYNNENQSVLYSQQRTGVNEVTLGMPQVGTPGTATGDLARVQEGKKKFDYSYANIKAYLTDLAIDFAVCTQQFGPRDVTYLDLNDPDGNIRKTLSLPDSYIRDGLVLDLTIAGEQDNNIINRQNWSQISGIYGQYIQGLVELAQLAQNQNLIPIIAQKGMMGATEAMVQILEGFGVRNIDRMVIKELLKNGGLRSGGPTAIPAGSNGVGITPQIPSIPGTPQGIEDNSGASGAAIAQLLQSVRGI